MRLTLPRVFDEEEGESISCPSVKARPFFCWVNGVCTPARRAAGDVAADLGLGGAGRDGKGTQSVRYSDRPWQAVAGCGRLSVARCGTLSVARCGTLWQAVAASSAAVADAHTLTALLEAAEQAHAAAAQARTEAEAAAEAAVVEKAAADEARGKGAYW